MPCHGGMGVYTQSCCVGYQDVALSKCCVAVTQGVQLSDTDVEFFSLVLWDSCGWSWRDLRRAPLSGLVAAFTMSRTRVFCSLQKGPCAVGWLQGPGRRRVQHGSTACSDRKVRAIRDCCQRPVVSSPHALLCNQLICVAVADTGVQHADALVLMLLAHVASCWSAQ